MLTKLKKNGFWYISLLVVLYLIGWSLTVMTDRINYRWYWQRLIPHVVFTGNIDQYSSEFGVAYVEKTNDHQSRITLKYDSGNSEIFTVETESLLIKDGQQVSDIDKLGYRSVTQPGLLMRGLWLTLQLSVIASFLGLVIGLFTGLGRISNNPLILGLSTIYVELIRNTPLLVQLYIIYFFVGTILELSRFTAGFIALAVFAGAYVAEIIRAGVQSIHPGQMEAARSLGMNYFQAMAYIILPQALRRTLPPLAGQFISLIKDSSLVSIIAITDLTRAAREIIQATFQTFEVWFAVAGMYFLLTFGLSMCVRYIERRFAVSD